MGALCDTTGALTAKCRLYHDRNLYYYRANS